MEDESPLLLYPWPTPRPTLGEFGGIHSVTQRPYMIYVHFQGPCSWCSWSWRRFRRRSHAAAASGLVVPYPPGFRPCIRISKLITAVYKVIRLIGRHRQDKTSPCMRPWPAGQGIPVPRRGMPLFNYCTLVATADVEEKASASGGSYLMSLSRYK